MKVATTNRRRYGLILASLLFLFCLRVVGQALVAFGHVTFLPPMEEWYSGLISYPVLLICQILIILLYGKVCVDFAGDCGYFVIPKARLGQNLVVIGAIYLAGMVVRYVLCMVLYPHERWLGGAIPIVFHCVLALFLLVLGHYHRSFTKNAETKQSPFPMHRLRGYVDD